MADASSSKGWYRYRLMFGAQLKGHTFDVNMFLHKRDKDGVQQDFSREEAEKVLRNIGKFMAENTDFKNLTEDF